MFAFKKLTLFVLLSISLSAVSGRPVYKRIAQVISESTQQWEKACTAAGGGQQCNPISVTAFSTLLAAAGPCEQQDSADAMINLAKQLNNDADMIKFAQIFAQQPRNTPNALAVPYCQQAPKNSELNGLFQCQFQGANQQSFVGGLQVGAAGTIPFGMTSPLSPAGSCPANPSGPIADGTQLVALTQDPGLGNVQNGGGNNNDSPSASASVAPVASESATPSSTAPDTSAPSPTPTDSMSCEDPDDDSDNDNYDDGNDNGNDNDDDDTLSSEVPEATPTPSESLAPSASVTPTPTVSDSTPVTPSATPSAPASGDFRLKNGQDAQTLNAKFAALTPDTTCNDGDQACVDGGFAQCISGKFVVQACSGGLTCVALPLVNKAGTSIACTTQADALARIAATGAQGGLTGN
ncbi:hypothetical protein NLI96_g9255 [Meripilus lineatus]|uniref:Carbohydrate-binding module family 19 domain-containing protein n=1 Tax=Meripilus lineatus TaxID=2056292 RepID=A0AAD5UVT1_9APHY|nr:hypothetical protein NLI96_g9255 [Physisporinus lineatus]